MKILIVGAGIGGLTAAVALLQRGHMVTIVERKEQLDGGGAGIMLQPNAIAVFTALGLRDELFAVASPLNTLSIDDHRGRVLSSTGKMAKFPPILALKRSALHALLIQASTKAVVRCGLSVKSITETEQAVDVIFTDDTVGTFDFVIGADGIGSKVRDLVTGLPSAVTYSGYTCWRAILPNPDPNTYAREIWGHGKRLGIIPLKDDQVYVFMVKNAPEGTPGDAVDIQSLIHEFSPFGDTVTAILASLPQHHVMHHDITEHRTHAYGTGRVALLGDAAHALTPNMGQGAAMAIEDAFILAKRLSTEPVQTVTKTYRDQREKRVKAIADQSRSIGKIGQLENTLLCWIRNLILRWVPRRLAERQLVSVWTALEGEL